MDIKVRVNNLLPQATDQPEASPESRPAPGDQSRPAGSETPDTLFPNDPSFVADLLEGTFQGVVDSSIKQMEGYSDLVKNVSGTVDEFDPTNVDQTSFSSDRKARGDDDN